MKLRVELASPFIVVGLYGLLVFGIIVPVFEGMRGVSADGAGGRSIGWEAQLKVDRAWREALRCLAADPARLGEYDRTVVLRLHVAPSGVVTGWETLESPDRSEPVRECLARIARTWTFTPSEKERTVDVTFDPARQAFDPSVTDSAPF